MQAVGAVAPAFTQRDAAAPLWVEAEALVKIGGDLKPRGKDQQVERVFLAIDDDP